MALEIRQSVALAQQLIMTPQLQQAIKLLQLSRLELLDAISQEMEENPVLEEQVADDEDRKPIEDKAESDKDLPDPPEVSVEDHAREDVDWDNYLSEYSTGWGGSTYDERETPSLENTTSARSSLHSHLMWQLNMSNFDDEQRIVGVYIIGNLDEDGYLDIALDEITQTINCPMDKVLKTLCLIQNFDPVGVAARDARESLLIQANFHKLKGTIVEKIIRDNLEDLENRKFDQLAKKLSVTIQEVLTAIAVIQGMEPKPGRCYSDDETNYIIPDIYVYKVGDNYEIIQNEDGLPKLRINSYYKEILRNKGALSDNGKTYIKEKLKSAAWLIKSIHQRQRTIYRVTKSIVKFQRSFFDYGITYLKPLILRNVAEDIEMHESTVSRVTTNKYVHTPQGIFELKFFFNSSINSINGPSVASESVKEHIKNIIKSENKKKPYSDETISEILKKADLIVARRTVAKYRESIGILPSRKRKNPY